MSVKNYLNNGFSITEMKASIFLLLSALVCFAQSDEYPNSIIKLVHNGAYIAQFDVSWDEVIRRGNALDFFSKHFL